MRGRDFADLLHADRIDKSCWVANCPAHDDHEFSLTIKDVYRCRVIVSCEKHCSEERIAKAGGISWRDFDSMPAADLDIEAMDDAQARSYLIKKRNREERHEIICGRIRKLRRHLDWLEGLERNARKHGGEYPDPAAEETRAELERLKDMERKLRA